MVVAKCIDQKSALASVCTMYDFDDSSDIFGVFEVGLAN